MILTEIMYCLGGLDDCGEYYALFRNTGYFWRRLCIVKEDWMIVAEIMHCSGRLDYFGGDYVLFRRTE